MAEEVNTNPAIHAASALGKAIYLPVVNHSALREAPLLFADYIPGETKMRANKYGIPEPSHVIGQCLRGPQLDLVCVPLVGFNQDFDRLGMGGGYYDRTFAFKQRQKKDQTGYCRRLPALIGLAHELQKQPQLELADWDIPLTAIATDMKIYWSQRRTLIWRDVALSLSCPPKEVR